MRKTKEFDEKSFWGEIDKSGKIRQREENSAFRKINEKNIEKHRNDYTKKPEKGLKEAKDCAAKIQKCAEFIEVCKKMLSNFFGQKTHAMQTSSPPTASILNIKEFSELNTRASLLGSQLEPRMGEIVPYRRLS